jgi:ADP-ribose pyrophosphatase YjhB (NUDIX family)
MNEPGFYRVSIKGIAVDENGRFLLSREDNGMWDMLGGGLDHGENPIDCLKREIHEESGLEVTWISDTPKYFVSSKRHGHDTYVANVVYEIKLNSLDFTPSDECQELRFFSTDEAKTEQIFPTIHELLKVFRPDNHDK